MHAMLRPLIAERRGPSGQHHDFLQTLVEARYADGRPLTDALIVSFIISLILPAMKLLRDRRVGA
jgi:cytochrome P450